MANVKIKFKVGDREIEGEVPESDFPNYEKKYGAKRVGGSAPKKASPAKEETKKEEPKFKKKK